MTGNTGNATELLQTQVAKILTKPLEAKSLFLASGRSSTTQPHRCSPWSFSLVETLVLTTTDGVRADSYF